MSYQQHESEHLHANGDMVEVADWLRWTFPCNPCTGMYIMSICSTSIAVAYFSVADELLKK